MDISATSSQSSSITTVMQNMGLNDQTGLIAASLLADASGCECECEDSDSALMLMALMAGSSTLTTSALISSSQSMSAYSDSPEQPSQLDIEG